MTVWQMKITRHMSWMCSWFRAQHHGHSGLIMPVIIHTEPSWSWPESVHPADITNMCIILNQDWCRSGIRLVSWTNIYFKIHRAIIIRPTFSWWEYFWRWLDQVLHLSVILPKWCLQLCTDWVRRIFRWYVKASVNMASGSTATRCECESTTLC